MTSRIASLIAAAAIAFAGAGHAEQFASTSKSVHLRAGPGRDYPVVSILAPRTPVTVYSCVPGYSWCDIASGADRGWVYAGNLVYLYENREVALPGVAAVIGIAIGAFILEDYWHDHYTTRWWWPVRRKWFRPPTLPPVREGPGMRPPPPVRPAPAPRVQPAPPHVQPGPRDRPHGKPAPHSAPRGGRPEGRR